MSILVPSSSSQLFSWWNQSSCASEIFSEPHWNPDLPSQWLHLFVFIYRCYLYCFLFLWIFLIYQAPCKELYMLSGSVWAANQDNSSGSWEVQGQGASRCSVKWGPPSWLADFHLLILSSHGGENESSSLSLLISTLISLCAVWRIHSDDLI